MLVRNWMSKDPIRINVEDTLSQAIDSLKENNIRELPVLDHGRLVGIITDGDMKKASASDATTLDVYELIYLTQNIKVGKIMTKNPITIPFDYTVEEAAEIMLDKKISCLPVTDHQGNLIGMITQSDVFRAMVALSDLSKRGVQFGLLLSDQPGLLKDLIDITQNHGGRTASSQSTHEGSPEGMRKVFLHIYDIDREKLSSLKEEFKKKAELLYMVDFRNNTREVYQWPEY